MSVDHIYLKRSHPGGETLTPVSVASLLSGGAVLELVSSPHALPDASPSREYVIHVVRSLRSFTALADVDVDLVCTPSLMLFPPLAMINYVAVALHEPICDLRSYGT